MKKLILAAGLAALLASTAHAQNVTQSFNECRQANGGFSWLTVTYAMFAEPAPTGRRVPVGIENTGNPCSEADYEQSRRNAAMWGENWPAMQQAQAPAPAPQAVAPAMRPQWSAPVVAAGPVFNAGPIFGGNPDRRRPHRPDGGGMGTGTGPGTTPTTTTPTTTTPTTTTPTTTTPTTTTPTTPTTPTTTTPTTKPDTVDHQKVADSLTAAAASLRGQANAIPPVSPSQIVQSAALNAQANALEAKAAEERAKAKALTDANGKGGQQNNNSNKKGGPANVNKNPNLPPNSKQTANPNVGAGPNGSKNPNLPPNSKQTANTNVGAGPNGSKNPNMPSHGHGALFRTNNPSMPGNKQIAPNGQAPGFGHNGSNMHANRTPSATTPNPTVARCCTSTSATNRANPGNQFKQRGVGTSMSRQAGPATNRFANAGSSSSRKH